MKETDVRRKLIAVAHHCYVMGYCDKEKGIEVDARELEEVANNFMGKDSLQNEKPKD